MNNESWVGAFIERHIERVARHDWPHLDSEFWETWPVALAGLKATERECDAASLVIAMSPPSFLDRQLAALLDAVRVAREAKSLTEGGTASDRKEAGDRSRGCPECGGCGLTSRWIWVARWERYASCGCICHRCEHGRWIEENSRDVKGIKPFALAKHPEWHDESLKYGPPAEVGVGAPIPDDLPPF